MEIIRIPQRPNYGMSRDGKVWSFKSGEPKEIKIKNGAVGQRQIYYLMDGITIRLSDTACYLFNGPRPSPNHEVRHLNGMFHDLRAENLVWELQTNRKKRQARLNRGFKCTSNC